MLRRRLFLQQHGKGAAKHGRAGRGQKAHATLYPTLETAQQQVVRSQRVKGIDLVAAISLLPPVEPLLEDAVAKVRHCMQVVGKVLVAVW